jgi:hypothetical protein
MIPPSLHATSRGGRAPDREIPAAAARPAPLPASLARLDRTSFIPTILAPSAATMRVGSLASTDRATRVTLLRYSIAIAQR